jgi:DNA-binding CsgD family transcriptional regulator
MDDILPDLYEAATEGRLWEEVAARMCPRLRAHGTLVYSVAPSPDCTTRLVAQSGFDASMMDSYLTCYVPRNARAPKMEELQEEEAVTSSMLFPDSRPKASGDYADWLGPQDIHYTIGGVVHTEAEVQYKLSFVRSESDGPFGEDDVTLVRGLLPHIKATMRVADKAGRLRALLTQPPAAERPDLGQWILSCRLSKAEEEVLHLLLEGMGAKEISGARHCSYHTTRSQIASLLAKTGHSTQRGLVAQVHQMAGTSASRPAPLLS